MKFLILLILFALCACSKEEASISNPVDVTGTSIKVDPQSKFASEIEVNTVKPAPGGERKLRTVGQMIAIANTTDELTDNAAAWVSLDPDLIHSLGLYLNPAAPAGLAYGLTAIAANYKNQLHVGEHVEVYRYGLRKNSISGTIVSVKNDSVIFSIAKGDDWYPGTNCQVEFPLIQRQAVTLSPLSMLHEGLREFVLKEIAPSSYAPVEITVVNETKDQVYAIGDIAANDHVIERGAILLKPLIHSFISQAKEVSHVR